MPNEVNGVAKWIYDTASASTVLQGIVGRHPSKRIWQIYETLAPEGAVFPYFIFAVMSGNTRTGGGGRKIHVIYTYQLKLVGGGDSFSPLAAGANELDDIFQQGQELDDPVIVGCRNVGLVQYSAVNDGVRENHLGGEFEIFAYSQGHQ